MSEQPCIPVQSGGVTVSVPIRALRDRIGPELFDRALRESMIAALDEERQQLDEARTDG